MARYEIIWSHRAKIKLYSILEFYVERNKSSIFSKKLYQKFNKELKVLIKHPEIGIKTDEEAIRGLIIDDFIIFYGITTSSIIVHTLWDCRQDPSSLTKK